MFSQGWMIFFFLDASFSNDTNSSSIPPTVTTSIQVSTSVPTPQTPQSGLSTGDIAALASSIPIGVLGLIIAAIALWYTRKQALAGKPLLTALRDDVRRVWVRRAYSLWTSQEKHCKKFAAINWPMLMFYCVDIFLSLFKEDVVIHRHLNVFVVSRYYNLSCLILIMDK